MINYVNTGDQCDDLDLLIKVFGLKKIITSYQSKYIPELCLKNCENNLVISQDHIRISESTHRIFKGRCHLREKLVRERVVEERIKSTTNTDSYDIDL